MEKRISKALLMTALITNSLLVSSVTAFAEESLNGGYCDENRKSTI